MDAYQRCKRCISDTTISDIQFDMDGVCNFCKIHDEMESEYPKGKLGQKKLDTIVQKIKIDGQNKDYDCIVGVSGGRDSTYVLYLTVKLGLRPLAVHFDNGWNSEIAARNIKNAVTKLNVDLYTVVADWEEFKSLQKSFLLASVSDAEIPTDVAIFGALHQAAAKEKVRYVINGHSFRTEGIVPLSWTYMDGLYIKDVHKKHGGNKVRTVPNFTIKDLIYYTFIKRINVVPILNYVEYFHDDVGALLEKELDWEYYGGHHHESYYTHFFQSYLLPQKFNIDKRILEYSAFVRSGYTTRKEALKEMSEKPYEFSEELVDYTIRKLGFSVEEFHTIMDMPVKSFEDYSTYYPAIKLLRRPSKMAVDFGFLPLLFYQKYWGGL
jgi:N-acetyl sugar amidotransferase